MDEETVGEAPAEEKLDWNNHPTYLQLGHDVALAVAKALGAENPEAVAAVALSNLKGE